MAELDPISPRRTLACVLCYLAQIVCVLVAAAGAWFTFTHVNPPYNQYWGGGFAFVTIFLLVAWNCRFTILGKQE